MCRKINICNRLTFTLCPYAQKTIACFIMGLLLLCTLSISYGDQQPLAQKPSPPIYMNGLTMGTNWKVTVPTLPKDVTDEDIFIEIKERLATINSKMSTYLPTSEVSKFNKSTSTDWFPISKETAIVIAEAQRVSQLSDGAFDITVAPLVNLWNFGPDIQQQLLPSDDLVKKRLKTVGYQKLHVRSTPPAIKKEIATLQIDLSAIAKGYAVDEVSKLLSEHEINNYLVDIGGEVRASGTKGDGTHWRLGVETPLPETKAIYQIIEPKNNAIATSGDYRNFRIIDGVIYSHTIDPRTGKPVNHQLASASVITKSCMTADAFATTLMVLGSKKGLRFAEEQKLNVMLIERDGKQLSHVTTKGFEKHISQKQPIKQPEKTVSIAPVFIVTFVVFGIAMFGMAIGYLLKRKCIQGSCGGLGAMKDDQGKPLCESCTSPSPECEQLAEKFEASKK